jgi:tRNA-specific 2-thiouridylase
MFVTRILPESNTVMLGTIEELEQSEALVRNFNLVKYESISKPLDAVTKIRYKDSGAMSTLIQEGDKIKVNFHHAVSGIAPGQSAVFYEGNDLLGGGFLV